MNYRSSIDKAIHSFAETLLTPGKYDKQNHDASRTHEQVTNNIL
ncbi:MAG TPA: hypothetical protein VMU83_03420 [Hanamia sp.]|nr:hypothetical protein [Hanamia sp.]